jgi:hypothetical protein
VAGGLFGSAATDGSAAGLLAGALAPVDVAVNGMPQGSLPIGGAEAALRQALGRCLRLPAR